MRRNLALMGLGIVVAAAALAGCGSDNGSAQMLERMLPRLVGPAQNYEVRVSGASSSRLSTANVRINRLQLGEGPVLDSALLQLADLRFNRDRQELLGVDRSDFSAVLLQEDLNAYLRQRSSLIRDLRIRLTPEGAQLRGSADIPGVRLPITPEFTLEGALAVDDMGRLSFEPRRIRVVGIEVPTVAAKLLATQINPLVDLTGLRLPVHLRDTELGNGEVRLFGRALLRPGQYHDLEPTRR